jgi:hypothetical protein
MKSKIIAIVNWVMGKNESGPSALNANIDNFTIKIGQLKMAIALLILGALGIGVISFILKEKVSKIEAKTTEPILTIEMADKKLDAEKHWRNYFEENQKKLATDFDLRLLKMEEAQKDMISSIKNTLLNEVCVSEATKVDTSGFKVFFEEQGLIFSEKYTIAFPEKLKKSTS